VRASRIIEALLFASESPLTPADLARADEGLDEERVEAAIAELRAEYDREQRAFTVHEVGGGYQLLTRPEFAPVLERFDSVPASQRLSGPALETLAIIAYRQPVGRAEVEEIRGVGAGGVLKTLQERGLVEVVGRSEALGRPLLYGTTQFFLQHFGFRGIDDLPRSEELPIVLARRETEPVSDAPEAQTSAL
jgi:segregation and condensation protein B